jgi:porphobilinogen synthase
MDPGNALEALKEIHLDELEGADMLMVKPALAYLDILWRVKEATQLPVAAYNVSGEYSLIKAASQMGWVNERQMVLETLTSMRRAGADFIFTYHAKDAAGWL